MTQKPRPAIDRTPRLTLDEVRDYLAVEFPQMSHDGPTYEIEQVGHGASSVRLLFHDRHLRPGGTVSGPSMMALADVALYIALLGAIGRVKLAVTTSLTINFLRKPEPRDVIAECRFLKIGRSLAVGEAQLRSEGGEELIAHVTATYSIPPKG